MIRYVLAAMLFICVLACLAASHLDFGTIKSSYSLDLIGSFRFWLEFVHRNNWHTKAKEINMISYCYLTAFFGIHKCNVGVYVFHLVVEWMFLVLEFCSRLYFFLLAILFLVQLFCLLISMDNTVD